MRIDINCDMGESFGAYRIGEDAEVMAHISSANIACGFHAGDPVVMGQTVRLAKTRGVQVGAHPGYPDLLGFGRRHLQTRPGEIRHYLLYQLGALEAFLRAEGLRMQHVKPHGALYTIASRQAEAADELIAAVRAYNPELIVVLLAGSLGAKMAQEAGLRVACEAFPDRAYLSSGELAPRSMPDAVIHDSRTVQERTVRLIMERRILAVDGKDVSLRADTLCIHGDTPGAATLAQAIRLALESSGVTVQPMGL